MPRDVYKELNKAYRKYVIIRRKCIQYRESYKQIEKMVEDNYPLLIEKADDLKKAHELYTQFLHKLNQAKTRLDEISEGIYS
jgi:spore coat polysaccharide biosynthesis protein SpsF (cytidylyltransferase family)